MEKLCFTTQVITRMAAWLLLTFFLCLHNQLSSIHIFLNKQSIFDPHPENCLSFSEKSPPKIVYQLFSRWSINFYCLNDQTFQTSMVYYRDT